MREIAYFQYFCNTGRIIDMHQLYMKYILIEAASFTSFVSTTKELLQSFLCLAKELHPTVCASNP